MIQLHHQALLVECYDGKIQPLDMQEFVRELVGENPIPSAALEPWMIERVVESIANHFHQDLKRDVISFSEILDVAKVLLESFFHENIEKQKHLVRLDLFEIARRCGTGFELEFYSEIRRFLATGTPSSSNQTRLGEPSKGSSLNRAVHITGLRRCAKFLSGRRRWSKRCAQLRDEIVSFIRDEASRAGDLNLALAVLS
jgi:hypothetical protein